MEVNELAKKEQISENRKTEEPSKESPIAMQVETTFYDPLAITWIEKYAEILEKYWEKLPSFLGPLIASVAVFLFGSTIRGEWIQIVAHFIRAFSYSNEVNSTRTQTSSDTPYYLMGINLDEYHLRDLGFYLIAATSVSFMMYFSIGGFLHWYYYVRRRDSAHEWKCQPDKWLSPALERDEIILGSFSLFLGSLISSLLSCYVVNGGKTTIYYVISDYGWFWYIASWPVVYIWQDYITYWTHRFYHLPFFYKYFHKLHHKYKQPTAFSVTAMHPIEFLHMQMGIISPMFIFPVHWTVFCTTIIYLFYHGIIDHSGINFKSYWWQPWQPDAIFHDNHHQYFHVNFGFNCALWDKIHGTYRQKNRIYREDIFYGKGKELNECSPEELKADLVERTAENTLAYRTDARQDQIREIENKLK